jgi:type VI secretion system protein ImpK
MSPVLSRKRTAVAVQIDALLQDSYLLVVELRQGASVDDGDAVRALCARQIEHVRQQLKSAGFSQRNIDYISHAHCALLDETVLGCAKDDAHSNWAGESLQAKFFGRHQAGDFVYEEMREVLREPAPDVHVLTVFQRVLMLGFRGRYADLNDPERMQLLGELNAQVAPVELSQSVATQVELGRRMSYQQWLRSPFAHVLAISLLLAGAWWGLDRLLGGLVAMLLPGAT